MAGLLALSALSAKEKLTEAELGSIEGGLCSVCDGVNPLSCPGLGTSCSGRTAAACGGTFTGCQNGTDHTDCGFGLGTCSENSGQNSCGDSTSTTCVFDEHHIGMDPFCTSTVLVTGACPVRDCTGTAY